MNWNYFFTALGGTATALAIAGGALCSTTNYWFNWLLKKYEGSVNERLKNLELMVELSHNKFLKDYDFQLKTREKAAGVAQLLTMAADRTQTVSATEFNRLAWELSLWLPADIVCELTRCLCGTEDAKHPKDILILVRKTLLGADDPLIAENIVHREERFNSLGGSRTKTMTGVSAPTAQ